MKKKTKIVATVGPASDKIETLESLARAGVDVFRLNFSHGNHEYHKATLDKIREVEQIIGRKIGILQDICGPKIRVGELDGVFELQPGDILEFCRKKIKGFKNENGAYRISINQPEILDLLKEDEYIFLCDGAIRVKVIRIDTHIVTRVENSGILSSNKGVNFPNTKININVITPKDKEDLLWGAKNEVDFVAISFVQNANDIRQAKAILKDANANPSVFAKIEKFDAVENIDEILEVCDGLMVARGDLGIEVPYFKVPILQKMLIKKANAVAKPVITATQMLLSMTKSESATRAEISDVANAVLDGTDAVMLSEESAVGQNPIKTVTVMKNTIKNTESIYPYNKFGKFDFVDETDIIVSSTTKLAQELKAKAMIVLTTSGMSAKKVAKYRTKSEILAVSHSDEIARKLTIVWGVYPIMTIKKDNPQFMFKNIISNALNEGVIDLHETYIAIAGYQTGIPGSTDFIRILKKDQLEYYRDL